MKKSLFIAIVFFLYTLSLPACASAPVKPVTGYTPEIGEKAADTAASMIGRPYQYRGETPAGFDCSGLVRYSYLAAGLNVPHGTEQLMRVTRSVGLGTIRKGDLLFFNERGGKYSHVGIWLGGDIFVHAPSTGGKVRTDSLGDPYWKKSLFGARRFL
jgi:cell wall-associated NlpC family hydrolase